MLKVGITAIVSVQCTLKVGITAIVRVCSVCGTHDNIRESYLQCIIVTGDLLLFVESRRQVTPCRARLVSCCTQL